MMTLQQLPFDPNYALSEIVPLIGVAIVALVGGLALRWFFRSPIAEAIAEGIRLRRRRRWGAEGDASALQADDRRLTEVSEQLPLLQEQVAELAERLDFAERMLAEWRERGRGRERTLGAGQ
jgi:hypothetical protein